MDRSQFDQLALQLAGASSSRGFKKAIGGRRSLLAAAVATAVFRMGVVGADARKRRKPRKRKQRAAAPNAFGCIDVGDLCQNDGQCCSGICDGKKGKRTCRAHDAGTCTAGNQVGAVAVTSRAPLLPENQAAAPPPPATPGTAPWSASASRARPTSIASKRLGECSGHTLPVSPARRSVRRPAPPVSPASSLTLSAREGDANARPSL
jgi:hypothetical protein